MMSASGAIPESLQAILRRYVPPGYAGALDAGMIVAPGGLDLDSVALLELLLACEERFQIPFPDTLLERPPLTVGQLADHLQRHRNQRP